MLKKPELVFIPLPVMGHLVSTVELAKLLVHLNSNLSITVFIIKSPYESKITSYIDSLTALTTSTTAISSRIKFVNLPQSYPDDVSKFMITLVQSSNPGTARERGHLANEFGVPSYAFYTSGAGFLGLVFHTQVLHDEQNVEFVELKDSDTEFTVPTYANPVSTKLFPAGVFRPEGFSFFLNMAKGLREMKGIMVNTFSELESLAVDSLSNVARRTTHSSVVFLCFGSMGSFTADQVKEIAFALEQSGHRFLWSVRKTAKQVNGRLGNPTDYENVAEVLPEGFLERTAGIGMVIGWAPQVVVLAHPATGGFVSHCGWNSTLESIWFGVPMAAWPLYAEQQLNALTMVRELGLAVEI
ncbi:hypothetical protein V6N13_045006 [Hibiscus sabdariffa]